MRCHLISSRCAEPPPLIHCRTTEYQLIGLDTRSSISCLYYSSTDLTGVHCLPRSVTLPTWLRCSGRVRAPFHIAYFLHLLLRQPPPHGKNLTIPSQLVRSALSQEIPTPPLPRHHLPYASDPAQSSCYFQRRNYPSKTHTSLFDEFLSALTAVTPRTTPYYDRDGHLC